MLFELPDPDVKKAPAEGDPEDPTVPTGATAVPRLVDETTDLQRAVTMRMLLGG